jgi:serine/threonine protein kinase
VKRVLPRGYEPVRLLSRNYDYDVRLVRSLERDCLCVAKSARTYRLADKAVSDRLLAEGALLTRLAHPHLVRGYETVLSPRPTVILEVLPGQTLSRLMHRRSRGLSVPDLARLGSQLCSALAYLHGQNVLHLDLKPSNLVVSGGLLKVLDLGLAQAPGPYAAGSGTPEYLAPEQARGSAVGPATDVWALGGVLYRAATLHRPFAEASEGDFPQLRRPVAPIRRRLPVAVRSLIMSCLSPSMEARPSVAEAATELRSLL